MRTGSVRDMSGAASSSAPVSQVTKDAVVFRVPDPEHALTAVSLWSDVELPDLGVPFGRVDGGWQLRIPLPRLARIEYLFELRGTGSGTTRVLDPTNPLRVGGAFGDHSWLPMPGYRAPDWLLAPEYPEIRVAHPVPETPVGEIWAEVWCPADSWPGEPLPVLACHDGPEMDRFGQLTRFVGASIGTGRLPRMRVALLAPGPRNERYAANPAYAAALADHLMPSLLAAFPSTHPPVLMGQSLGALAALHAEWTHPGTFGGLFLQSGSFFTADLDPQESGFGGFAAVTDFTAQLAAGTGGSSTSPASLSPTRPSVTIVCGTAEENLANNRRTAALLAEQGVDVAWGEVADGHYWTTWRDLLDPHLTELLRKVWR